MTYAMLALALTSGLAMAQPASVDLGPADRDRWMYPFNFSPGVRAVATTFGATVAGPGFDDRDAQFVVGWDTDPEIPAGEPSVNYRIASARVTLTIAAGDQMAYDPTLDTYATYLDETDPGFVPDADAGRPVVLHPAAYRNGFDLATWEEFSVFGGVPAVEPAQGARNVYPANFDAQGVPFDVSNNVKEGFDPAPYAVGQFPGVTPGALVPQDAPVVFELDLTDPDFVGYLQESLSAGRLNLVVSSLHFASGGPDGGAGDPQYPAFYTKEDPVASILGFEPRLEITYELASPVDFNGDGIIDNGDIGAFVALFIAGDLRADVNDDGVLDNGDIGTFVQLFLAATG
ncbi:MAG: GC-type dockerin domain-anchored protein [Phycisphaerales bacterium JB040]